MNTTTASFRTGGSDDDASLLLARLISFVATPLGSLFVVVRKRSSFYEQNFTEREKEKKHPCVPSLGFKRK